MKQRLKRLVPEALRERVRRHPLWRRRYDHRHAVDLGSTSKRLDLCSAQMAHMLHLADHAPLHGKVCLEIGCGWILTHALVCHLLGAERVIATDIEAMARPRYLPTAIRGAVPYIVRDVLSPFTPHPEVRARLDRLLKIEHFDFDVLQGLGIEYVAPVDLARESLGRPVDFIYSLSVLEHVPVDDVAPLLRHLVADLRPGGTMIHAIHLEDHRGIADAPFTFLAEPAASYGAREQTLHGNRLRRSEWRRLFDELEDFESRFLYEFRRLDKDLPPQIDGAVTHEDEDDLRVSHVGAYGIKKGKADV
jgi:SAM-dependent methyltransferase